MYANTNNHTSAVDPSIYGWIELTATKARKNKLWMVSGNFNGKPYKVQTTDYRKAVCLAGFWGFDLTEN